MDDDSADGECLLQPQPGEIVFGGAAAASYFDPQRTGGELAASALSLATS
jgi:hypothetical protein